MGNRHSVLSILNAGLVIGCYLGFSIKIACFEVKVIGLKNNVCVVSENFTDLPLALEKVKTHLHTNLAGIKAGKGFGVDWYSSQTASLSN